MTEQNPLLCTDGLPRFRDIEPVHAEPAIRRVLTENRERLAQILAADEPRTWENTVAPVEAMEHRLARVWSPVAHLNAVANDAQLREAYRSCLNLLSEYHSEMGQNEALYRAYLAVAQGDEPLDPAQRKLLADALRDFRLGGVDLGPDDKKHYRDIMQELSQLQARFEEHVLDTTNAWSRHIENEGALSGIPDRALARAGEEATRRGLQGWVFTLDFPSYHAVVTYAEDRDLRHDFYEAWVTRASETGPHDKRLDNSPVMERIVELRHALACLLGFDNFAEYSLATKMAMSLEEVMRFLRDLGRRSRPGALRELEELREFAGHELEAWDMAWSAEKLRKQRFNISDEALRPYFPATRALQGLFEVTTRLFGVTINEREDVDTWHSDVEYFDLRDKATGALRGGFFVDLYARAHKRGGAWMDECIGRAQLQGRLDLPVAYLVCNFAPPLADQPALLTHDEVVTLFHEFGHTLHHLLTRVDYPSVSGINGVPWDAVELPSQFMENFAWREEVLPLVSAHFETGEALPEKDFRRLLGTRSFHAGLQMLRQIEFALFDFRLHAEYDPTRGANLADLLAEVREEISVVPVPPFNRFANGFSHIFGGGYAAGYYSYKWAEVLSADAFSAFEEGPVIDPVTGARFAQAILEIGGTRDAMEAFVEFRGRPPSLEPLLRHSGIAVTVATNG